MEKKKYSFPVTLLSFSGCYERQGLVERLGGHLLDLIELSGTNCYLDEQALIFLKEALPATKLRGVHFLDSGNFHYVSYLWCSLVTEPFRLLVLDRHTDMQPSAFGPILSCGGWLASVLEENPWIREVILIGPEKNAFEKTDPGLQSKVRFFSQQDYLLHPEHILAYLEEMDMSLPLYLSIDKDVCSAECAITDWDQGEMGEELFMEILRRTCSAAQRAGNALLGADICGDTREENALAEQINGRMNWKLLDLLEGFGELFWIPLKGAQARDSIGK